MTTDQKDDLNHLYFDIGAGLQLQFGKVVVCPEILYGWKAKSKLDTDYESALTSTFGWSTSSVTEGKLDIGVLIGLALD